LWFSILTIKQSYIVNNQMKNLTELTQLSISYSELVHELQKERGTTAGFLGSKGKTFATRLNKQRFATDDKLNLRDAFLKLNDFKQVSIVKLNQEIAAELEKLNLIRSQVSDLAIDGSKAIAYYTGLNAKLLSVSYIIADLSINAKVTELSIAYYNFLQGKERAGIERAVLSSTFARDEFSEGTFVKFVALVTEQKVFMANFLAFTSAENIRYYQKQMAHPAIKEVIKLRTIAESKTSGFGVDPLYWFQQATLRIGQFQKSGQQIADNLLLFVKNAQATTFNTLAVSIAVTIVLLILVIVITRESIKDLTSRVNELTQVMKRVRNESDLTVRTKLQGKSELGQISIALNLTLEQFSDTINEISSASLTLSAAAEETSVTCEHNAITLAEQQEGIVAIATAVEELSATVKEVAGNTQATADSAREADSQAKNGLDVVQLSYYSIEELSTEIDRLAQRINSLHASSGNITKVVDVIKSVAEQTNLLALNAAIEAARAGEQGRGFAVVADEVRTLAKRTQQSTLEIESFIGSLQADANAAHQVIENSQQKASVAVENSKNVEHSLQQITSTISNIFAMTEQVATAIEEQSVVIQDVAQNIINIEVKSSETVAGATQIAVTAKEQAYLATRMQDLANRFHI
jgi:methyl-accepting chemotaxis protein